MGCAVLTSVQHPRALPYSIYTSLNHLGDTLGDFNLVS